MHAYAHSKTPPDDPSLVLGAHFDTLWDSVLLAYADRSRVIPDEHRPHVIRRNGDALPTVVVEGLVRGVWRASTDAIEVRALEPMDDATLDSLDEQARDLRRLLADREPAVHDQLVGVGASRRVSMTMSPSIGSLVAVAGGHQPAWSSTGQGAACDVAPGHRPAWPCGRLRRVVASCCVGGRARLRRVRVIVRCLGWVVLASVLVTWAVGCGDVRNNANNSQMSATQSGRWAAEVSSVSPGADGQSLIARVDVLPVEGSTGECAVDVEHTVEPEGNVVYVNVSFTLDAPAPDPLFPLCETAPRDVVIELGSPLAGRHVITQTPIARWRPTTAGNYERCELPGCDPGTGTTPQPATCGDTTLADAVRNSDVPRHAGLGNKRCELPWAVIDVDIGAGACPASGDGTNTCSGQNVRRTYWKAVGYTWEPVGASTGTGCGDIASVVPGFPIHLCTDLPSLP